MSEPQIDDDATKQRLNAIAREMDRICEADYDPELRLTIPNGSAVNFAANSLAECLIHAGEQIKIDGLQVAKLDEIWRSPLVSGD